MSTPAALEFRVLSGSQAGCRVPLRAGIYRAGNAPSCDLLLDGLAQGDVAFVLYVGHQEVALEAVAPALMLAGRRVQNLTPLGLGLVFALGERLFAVDHDKAPWPENPVPSLPDLESEAAPPPDEAPSGTPPQPAAEAVADPLVEPLPDFTDSTVAARETDTAPPRRRLPFWAWWLMGTACFITLGLVALLVSLRPADAPPVPGPEAVALALEQTVAATKGEAKLELEKLADGRWRVKGYVGTRDQKAEISRKLRAITPGILLQISADQDLLALTRDTLGRFAALNIELVGLAFGELTLRGHVAAAAQRDQVSKALFDEVPGLRTIHSEITAADDALVAMLELLAEAGLQGRIVGQQEGARLLVGGMPEPAERNRWREIRRQLEARFGPALEIVENFRDIPATPRSDVVLAVMGPVPYVVLSNGDKEGRRPADLPGRAR